MRAPAIKIEYVLTLKMNQSVSQNIRYIYTTIKILLGPSKYGGSGYVPAVPAPKLGSAPTWVLGLTLIGQDFGIMKRATKHSPPIPSRLSY